MISKGNASLGGGLYINNLEYMLIQNTKFISNIVENDTSLTTSGYGGGLYYTCQSTNLCEINITANNNFTSNYAANSGGGIKWDDLEPNFDSSNYYMDNFAYLYGDNIACFAEKIVALN